MTTMFSIKSKLTLIVLIMSLAIVSSLCGCASSEQENENRTEDSELISRDFFAMDTYMTVSSYGENAEEGLIQVEKMIEGMEKEVSTEVESSQIARLNAASSGKLSGDCLTLVDTALRLYEETSGAFNISVYPLVREWGFTTEDYKVPDSQTISELLNYTDLSTVDLDRETGEIDFRQKKMEIDLGGITKGLASANAVSILKDNGLKGGVVNLGGNVQVFGTKPDGSDWRIAVQSPYEKDDYIGIIELTDKAVITSGGYERCFEKDGKTYHHILDPQTGCPAESGLISVTIVSSDGCEADGLSTALYVMGKEGAETFWREHSDRFDFILMDSDNQLYITENIAEVFTSDQYEVSVIRK